MAKSTELSKLIETTTNRKPVPLSFPPTEIFQTFRMPENGFRDGFSLFSTMFPTRTRRILVSFGLSPGRPYCLHFPPPTRTGGTSDVSTISRADRNRAVSPGEGGDSHACNRTVRPGITAAYIGRVCVKKENNRSVTAYEWMFKFAFDPRETRALNP